MHLGSLCWGGDLSEKLPDFTICNLGNFPELKVTIYYFDNRSDNKKAINRFIKVLLLGLWITEQNLLHCKTL